MKKIFTYCFNTVIVFIFCAVIPLSLFAQQSDTIIKKEKFFKRIPVDTSGTKMNMDAAYNRPFITAAKIPLAIGGYIETNTQYQTTDGISDGFSFQMRRFTLFFSSTIAKRIRLLSELEFEGGTKEINLEFAAMDIEFHPLLNFRGGVMMNPIGAFNQNHDGPKWDFIDRPVAATALIPSTFSNAGFGLHGKYFFRNWILGYETYITNGFTDQIISNTDNRTSLSAAKQNVFRFEENNSGLPLFTGKIAVRNRKIGEAGISFLTGVYNRWRIDGITLDKKRSVSILAFDFNTSVAKNRLNITGELVKVFVDVPATYTEQFGTQQIGAYLDLVGTVHVFKMLSWENAKLNIGIRLEYVDFNQDKFKANKQPISDHLWAITPSLAFRPVGSTVIRFNYRYQQQTDLLGNPPSKTGAIQFGISTYF